MTRAEIKAEVEWLLEYEALARQSPQAHRFGSEGIEGIEREFFDPGDSGNMFAPDASRPS
ncbi:hypothetical protein [Mesorhizobium sp.]|uniref:hypothetical protein n=1 Tax=Mesorhizobium sp. TaxID=1871066 RepID=UPI001217B47B|nr:hypothetical protein [Mesorhizobium sp.]TIM39022.1 MAG: hypothetical protein E5Y56_27700 [Mesorhizobium sp.]